MSGRARAEMQQAATTTKVGPVRAEKIARRVYPAADRIKYLAKARGSVVVVHEGNLARIVSVEVLDSDDGLSCDT